MKTIIDLIINPKITEELLNQDNRNILLKEIGIPIRDEVSVETDYNYISVGSK